MPPEVIDLSHELATGMPAFGLHSPTHVLPWATRQARGFQSEALFCNTHAGTHVDAPVHFLADGDAVDRISLTRFFGPAVALDLTGLPPRSHIGAAQLERCAAEQIAPRAGDIVLLYTGIDARYGEREYLTDFSGLSEEGADHLARLEIKAVGTDAAGIDAALARKGEEPRSGAEPGAHGVTARPYPAHHVLLPRGIVVFENLANLGRLLQVARGRRFTFHALPLKIRGASGSPVRAMALVE